MGPSPTGTAGAVWTNQVNGKVDPNAQTVEIDILAAPYAAPAGQASVSIWGVPLQQMWQSSDFNNASIKVFGGMQAGLPLATAAAKQSGLLLTGTILASFGNWIGANQTLNFVVTADGGATQSNPGNITICWTKGQQMSTAIQNTLSVAYPSLKLSVNIDSRLVLPADEIGTYQTIQQFASYVKGVSQSIIGGTYPGVDIWIQDQSLNVFDGSSPVGGANGATQINFADMLGQPTWLSPFELQFNTVMRADMTIGSTLQFPQLAQFQTVTTPQSQSQAKNKSTFSGTWTVDFMRHVGNSRAPDPMSWITSFQAYSSGIPQSDSLGASSA